jgi:Sulfotransferase family
VALRGKDVAQIFEPGRLRECADALATKQVFFVCGAAKSGTTWARMLLDSHPEVVCLGEGHFANQLLPTLERALASHNERIAGKNEVVFRELAPFPLFRKGHAFHLLVAAINLVLGEFALTPGVRAVGEKTPDSVHHLPLLAGAFPKARFIHVVRDGRDCAVSCWYHNLRVNRAWIDRNFATFDEFVQHYAKAWAQTMRAARAFADRAGDRYIELRYEDMCADPRRGAAAAFEFLGVSTAPDLVARCCAAASFTAASGGRQPGEEDVQSFFRKGVPGDWHHHLDDDAAHRFAATADDWLARLGYAT